MGVKVNKGTWTDPGTGKVEPERETTFTDGVDGGYAEDNVEPDRGVSYHPVEDDMPPVKQVEPIRVETTTAETPPTVKADKPKDKAADEDENSESKAKKAKANKAKSAPPENKSK